MKIFILFSEQDFLRSVYPSAPRHKDMYGDLS